MREETYRPFQSSWQRTEYLSRLKGKYISLYAIPNGDDSHQRTIDTEILPSNPINMSNPEDASDDPRAGRRDLSPSHIPHSAFHNSGRQHGSLRSSRNPLQRGRPGTGAPAISRREGSRLATMQETLSEQQNIGPPPHSTNAPAATPQLDWASLPRLITAFDALARAVDLQVALMRKDRLTIPIRCGSLFTFVTIELPMTLPALKETLFRALVHVSQQQGESTSFLRANRDVRLEISWEREWDNGFPSNLVIDEQNVLALLTFLEERKGYYLLDVVVG